MRLSYLAILVTGLTACQQEVQPPANQIALPAPVSEQPATVDVAPDETRALEPEDFYALAEKSVVLVQNIDVGSLGSGVEIFDGVFVTNCHVLQGGTTFKLVRGKRSLPATLGKHDVGRDTCLLTATDTESHPVATRSARTLKVGERVYALGNPQGLQLTLSTGIVSQLRQGFGDTPLIQTNASISQGSSGGGIFDKSGQLVGISTFMLKEGQNLNFAVPIDWALELYASKEPVAELPPPEQEQPESQSDAEADIPKDDPRALNERGIALIRSGNPSQAVPVLTSAAQIAPSDPEILGNLGYALLLSGEEHDAKRVLLAALEIAPKRATTWLNLGQAYAELGEHDLAVRTIRNGYSLSSRKTAVLSALRATASDPDASDSWRDVAASAANSIQSADSATDAQTE